MATPTYDLVAESTLSADASQIQITGLPTADYDIFVVELSFKLTVNTQVMLTMNNSGASFYHHRGIYQRGGSFNIHTGTSQPYMYTTWYGSAADEAKTLYATLYNASSSTDYKPITVRSADRYFAWVGNGMWNNTSALTSIEFFPTSGNLLANTNIRVYGLVQ